MSESDDQNVDLGSREKGIDEYAECFDVLQQLIEKDASYNNIELLILKNSFIFKEMIKFLRNINPILKFNFEKLDSNCKAYLKLPLNFCPIQCNPDGNCLYNSICLFLFGKNGQKYYNIIKLCTIFIFFQHKTFFDIFLFDSFEKFIEKTCRKNEYGTETSILALTIVLNRKIILYNSSLNEKNNIARVVFNVNNNVRSEAILIGLIHQHFFPIKIRNNVINENINNMDHAFIDEYLYFDIDLY